MDILLYRTILFPMCWFYCCIIFISPTEFIYVHARLCLLLKTRIERQLFNGRWTISNRKRNSTRYKTLIQDWETKKKKRILKRIFQTYWLQSDDKMLLYKNNNTIHIKILFKKRDWYHKFVSFLLNFQCSVSLGVYAFD